MSEQEHRDLMNVIFYTRTYSDGDIQESARRLMLWLDQIEVTLDQIEYDLDQVELSSDQE
jgi:hypothetical protein